MRIFLVIAAICMSFPGLMGQSLTPFVVASSGDFFVNSAANASLSFTVGEMTMVETFSAQNYILTQGFQQPEVSLTDLAEEDFVYEFVVYPNPASEFLNVRYRLRHPGVLRMQFFNMNGVRVLEMHESSYVSGLEKDVFDLSQIAQGMYFLQVDYEIPARNLSHTSHYKINVIKH